MTNYNKVHTIGISNVKMGNSLSVSSQDLNSLESPILSSTMKNIMPQAPKNICIVCAVVS